MLDGAFVGDVWFRSGSFVEINDVPLVAGIGAGVIDGLDAGFIVVNPDSMSEGLGVVLLKVVLPTSSSSEPGTGVGFCGSTLAAPVSCTWVAFVSVLFMPTVEVEDVWFTSGNLVDPL